MGPLRNPRLILFALALVTQVGSTARHAKSENSGGKTREQPGQGNAPETKIEPRAPLPGQESAPYRVVLDPDRCKPGTFFYPGGHCPVLGRGQTLPYPKPGFIKGSYPGKGNCYYKNETGEDGATPIPTKQYYNVGFERMDTGPIGSSTHPWGTFKRDRNGKVMSKSSSLANLDPTPVFHLNLDPGDGNRLPSGYSRDMSTVRLHTHGQNAEFDEIWKHPSHGCIVILPKCMKEFYAQQGNKGFRLEIYEK